MIKTGERLCQLCGFPMQFDERLDERGFGSVTKLHKCPDLPAHEQLAALSKALDNVELALEEKMEIAKYNALLRNPDIKYPHRLSREGDDGRWYGYSQALGLLHQAREGKLKTGGDK